MTALCSVAGCSRESKARGYCKMHWKRWRNHGDALWQSTRRSNGTGTFTTFGYLKVSNNGKQTGAHVLVAERALGRPLAAPEEVHHINGIRSDNAASNLVICPNRAYHMLLHQRQRAIDACGVPYFRKCKFCKSYSDPADMAVYGTSAYHYACFNAWRKNRYGVNYGSPVCPSE